MFVVAVNVQASMPKVADSEGWFDRLERPLRELRVSVTDRCNLRCRYCMPREHFGANHNFVPREQILNFEEITRVVRILHKVGLRKVRLTGGEPLLREELNVLVRMLKAIPNLEVALTTNGILLPRHARALKAAGLDRITLSLDALDEAVFQRITDSQFAPRDVLRALDAAVAAGFTSLKINCVIKRGVNDNQILPMVDHFRHTPHELRFIEFMDTGETTAWAFSDVVTANEILSRVQEQFAVEPIFETEYGQTSRMYRHRTGPGRVGVIASVSSPFCGNCTRARLTAKGEIYTCLFGTTALDVRRLLRSEHSDTDILEALHATWSAREDQYSELRGAKPTTANDAPTVPVSRLIGGQKGRPEMSYLGG